VHSKARSVAIDDVYLSGEIHGEASTSRPPEIESCIRVGRLVRSLWELRECQTIVLNVLVRSRNLTLSRKRGIGMVLQSSTASDGVLPFQLFWVTFLHQRRRLNGDVRRRLVKSWNHCDKVPDMIMPR
jgi:hypothetical protein